MHNIISYFEQTVKQYQHKIAVTIGDKAITYGALNDKANALANSLLHKGIGKNDVVPLMAERSIERIVGIIGILKAGAAYLPLSETNPHLRIQQLIEDCGCNKIVCKKKHTHFFKHTKNLVILEEINTSQETTTHPGINISQDQLAYVIYTSGSTGNPKGVMIEHGALINRLEWMQQQYKLTPQDVLLQKTPYTFDVSVWELLWWMMVGASLHLLLPGSEKLPMAITHDVEKSKVSFIHFVPSMLGVFLQYTAHAEDAPRLKSLKRVFCSGEALKAKHAKDLNEVLGKTNQTKLTNLYGPTEATIDITYYDVDLEHIPEVIPVGKVIKNNQGFLVSDNQVVTDGTPGELWVKGVGVARGYLNRKALTKEKFESNLKGYEGKVYKTGDLMRWLPDGNLEYLGRIDHQVKIHGIRIELGEIEAAINSYQGVIDSAVIVRSYNENIKVLEAYIVATYQDANTLKEHLKSVLPEHMIPKKYIYIEALPLTKNGKLDRKKLLAIELQSIA